MSLSHNNRSNSVVSLRTTIGDLMSGRAFENNCSCVDAYFQSHQTDAAAAMMMISSDECQLCLNSAAVASNTGEALEHEDEIAARSSTLINTPDSLASTSPPKLIHANTTRNRSPPVNTTTTTTTTTTNSASSSDFECTCNAPRLAPEFEFMKSLVSIGKKLIRLASKELKSMIDY